MPNNQRLFCLLGVLTAGCALPKMNSDYEGTAGAPAGNSGGAARAGAGNSGRASTVGAMGHAGRGNGGASNAAGVLAAGGVGNLGGATGTLIASGGTAITPGETPAGGNSSLGGASDSTRLSSVAGSETNGGATSVTGTTSTAGAKSTTTATIAGGTAGSGVGGIGGKSNTGGTVTSIAAAGGVSGTGTTGGGTSSGGTGLVGVAGATGASSKPTVISLSAGWYHTCAVMSDGTLRCWGVNCDGRLGDGGAIPDCLTAASCSATAGLCSPKPIQVQGISGATAVAAGGYHTCAVVSGKILCWGYNSEGQLGNGSSASSSVPVEVSGITAAQAVVTGERHSCALLESGQVQCWGQNLSNTGQLGDGTGVSKNVPVSVVIDNQSPPTLLTGVTKIAATDSHTCALRANGDLYCWGSNDWGQCGIDSEAYNHTLIAVKAVNFHTNAGTAKALAIGAGTSFSCALLDDGSVRCWGLPWWGSLGDGVDYYVDDTPKLTYAPSASGPLALTVGGGHSCVIMPNTSHNAQCWGSDGIGDGTDNTALVPVNVWVGPTADATNLVQIQSMSAGRSHSCAVVASGSVYCWGAGDSGQLGAGNYNDATTAQLVPGL